MPSSLDKQTIARVKLRARGRRIALIRRRVAGFSALLFVVLWTVVFGQLVVGRDPALARKAARRPAARRHMPARRRRADVVDLGKLRRRPVTARPDDRAPAPSTPSTPSTTATPSAAPAAPAAPQPAPTPTPVTTSQS